MKLPLGLLFCAAAAGALPGCVLVPGTQWNSLQAENRALEEQKRAQLAEMDNLKAHQHDIEDRVIRSEKQLALAHQRADIDQQQLEGYRRERDELYGQVQAAAFAHGRLPPELGRQLADLAQRYPNLHFDPETGISKLDTDILFDSGEAVLKPGAGQLLDELVRVLRSPAAGDLKIMVAGHTDNEQIVGPDVRDKYPDNFHLSAARALAVADRMKRSGLPEHRIGVAGFGANQPIAPNMTAADRQTNRRVEIFVVAPETPVVGWSESTPSVYGAGVRR